MNSRKILKALTAEENNGFSLIETLIAIAILSVGLLGMGKLVVSIISTNKLSEDMTIATVLTKDKMEDVRGQGYVGTPASDTTITENYDAMTGYPAFKRVTFVDADNPANGMKTVTVTVFWQADTHSVEFQTILAR